MKPEIKNNVVGAKTIEWCELKGYEFNSLKSADNRDITKLKAAILNSGFNFPFYVWHDHQYVIDGKGRDIALNELESEGHVIPPLPIVEIKADSKEQAKKLVLQASSIHGEITQESFEDFVIDLDLQPFDFEMFDLDIDEIDDILNGAEEAGSQEEKYTMKTDVFTYEPTGDKPDIGVLYDDTKTKELIDEIKKATYPSKKSNF